VEIAHFFVEAMALEEDSPIAGREAVDEDGAEDNPDWSLLAKFAR